jgi:hypothetical protein
LQDKIDHIQEYRNEEYHCGDKRDYHRHSGPFRNTIREAEQESGDICILSIAGEQYPTTPVITSKDTDLGKKELVP